MVRYYQIVQNIGEEVFRYTVCPNKVTVGLTSKNGT